MRQLSAISSKLLALLLLATVACSLGCGTPGPAVPLTTDQQINIQITTQEQQFMTLYRSARNYVLLNPQHTDQWNNVIQPAFSSAHELLMQYEHDMLGQKMSIAEMERLINKLTFDLTQMMLAIGWVQ